MCYDQLGEFWNKTKWIDPIASQSLEHQTDLFSDTAESLGKRWNMPWLEEEAKYNKDHTSEALGKAAVATGSAYLGNWMSGLMGGGGAGYVDQLGNAAEGALAGASTTGGLMGTGMNAQQAMKMMQLMQSMQPQQQPMPQPPPPQQQGQYEPLPMMGEQEMPEMPKDPRFMTEEEKRKRKMMMGGFY